MQKSLHGPDTVRTYPGVNNKTGPLGLMLEQHGISVHLLSPVYTPGQCFYFG
jgi:hypothetical protein